MGWSFEHRDKGTSNLDYFREGWSEGYELLDGATVGGTFYGALRRPDGKVEAVVNLTRWVPNDYFNFGYKSMTESWGPGESRCPQRILDMLSPVEELYPEGSDARQWASEWRERCREYRDAMAKVKVGTRLFLQGKVYEVLDLRRNIFRHEHGYRVRIPWWRSVTPQVVPNV